MSERPQYVGLLNRISLAESRAHAYLSAWADTTPSPEVRNVLLTVAAREGEHGMSMAKRVNELGYEFERTDDGGLEAKMAIARSGISDGAKFDALGLSKYFTGDGPDLFENFFKDHSIDIQTGALLGRYIAEERDSTRQLNNCYDLCKLADAAGNQTSMAPAAGGDRLGALDSKVDALCAAVDQLCQVVTAQMVPAAVSTNGKQKARAKA